MNIISKKEVCNVSKLMLEVLPDKIINLLKSAGKLAEELKMNAYVVGGFVRDLFLQMINYDIDIIVEGDGMYFAKVIGSYYGLKVKCHKRFKTAVIYFNDKIKMDIASARLEYYEKPAVLPKIEMSSLKMDLYRRDFTINTLAIRINPEFFGELIDYFGAKRDLKNKIIRVLHNQSFIDDPTRIFRAIRYEQRYGFHINKLTLNLVEDAVKKNLLDMIKGKRLYDELILIFQEENVIPMIKRMSELGLLRFIHPKIVFDNIIENTLKKINEIINWFNQYFPEEKYEKWILYLGGLLERLNYDDLLIVESNLTLPKFVMLKILMIKEKVPQVLSKISYDIKPSKVYSFLAPLPLEVQLYVLVKAEKYEIKKIISSYFTHLRQISLEINGDDLIKLGFLPGKIFKKILDATLNAKIDGVLRNKEDEIKYVKENFMKMLKS